MKIIANIFISVLMNYGGYYKGRPEKNLSLLGWLLACVLLEFHNISSQSLLSTNIALHDTKR